MRYRISIVIPSYQRQTDLRRCLEALSKQTIFADQVIVVCRDSDHQTLQVVQDAMAHLPGLSYAEVTEPGQVAALNRGLCASTGDIVSITDDDAAPHPDWVDRILNHFENDANLVGLGGRDWLWYGDRLVTSNRSVVGRVQWFGRTIGNHHLGYGSLREVDILKGANMSFRTAALGSFRFDHRLRGHGAQVHNDLAFSLAIRAKRMKLVYDPAVAVDHYNSIRADDDSNHRGGFHGPTLADAAHNETLILLEYLPPLRQAFYAAWAILVGTWQFPGLLQLVRLVTLGRKHTYTGQSIARWRATMRGRFDGWLAYRRYRSMPEETNSTAQPSLTQ